MFYSVDHYWVGEKVPFTELSQLPAAWKNEVFLKGRTEFNFSYRLDGLKKAGTEAFTVSYHLNFRMDTYWYGFILVNYNDQQPFLKKTYDEQLDSAHMHSIADTIYNEVMKNIEWNIERITNKNKKLEK